MRKIGFVRGCCFEHLATPLPAPNLVAPISPQFPPTRCVLVPPVVGTEKPLFLLRALPQKKSDFAVLIADVVCLELVAWHPPGVRALACSAQGQLRGSAYLGTREPPAWAGG